MILRGLWVVLRWTLLILAMTMASLIATVSMVVSTEPGTRWVLSQAERFLPLELGEVRGNLLTGLDVSYFDYQMQVDGQVSQHYRGEQVSFRWQPLALFYNAVSVQSLHARDLWIQIPEGDETVEPEPMKWPVLALPVRIQLDNVEVQHIQVVRTVSGAEPAPLVTINSVTGSASLGTFNLRLYDLAVATDDYAVIANGRAALRYPYDAELQVQWLFDLPAADENSEPVRLSGKGDIGGDIETLTIDHRLLTPLEVHSRGQLTPNLSAPPAFVTALANPVVELHNEMLSQALPSAWFVPDLPPPMIAANLDVKGWIDSYQVELTGQVQYDEMPEVAVNATAQGDLSQINIAGLQLSTVVPESGDTMALELAGLLTWAPTLSWDATLSGRGLNPALVVADWPGDLTLALQSKGSLVDGALDLAVDNLDLSGQLRGREAGGSGAMTFAGDELTFTDLLLSMGANHIRLDGRAGEQVELRWQLEAPLLAQIDSSLSGTISSRGEISGSLKDPQIDLELRANTLRWQEYALNSLELVANSPRRNQYKVDLNAQSLSVAGNAIDQITLNVDGSVEAHKVALDVSAPQGELGVSLDSAYRNEQWQGNWTRWDMRLAGLPRWWLLNSKPSTASAERAELGELCLTTRTGGRRNEGRDTTEAVGDVVVIDNDPVPDTPASGEETPALCLAGQWSQADGVVARGNLSAIPLRQFRSFLKPDVDIAGVIDGQLSATIKPGATPEAALSLKTRDGELSIQYQDNPPERYRWQQAEVTGALKNNQATARVAFDWAPFGEIDADVAFHLERQQLGGRISATFPDLSPFAAFIPKVDDLRGRLATDLTLSGSLQQPSVVGQLTLVEGGATLTELGLDIQAVGVTVDSLPGGQITFRGNAQSGEGELRLTGDFEGLGKPDWKLNGQLNGNNFQVLDQSQIKARITPAIALSASPDEIRLSGNALIPYARIEIKTLPESATRVSSDVVLEDEPEAEPLPIPAFFMNLTIEVGDDVQFKGFGLSSGLSGKVELNQTPDRPLITSGFVGVTEGKYRAYGQELTIARGRLIFQGPADNPGLEIRAQRVLRGSDEQIVGLEIGGSLQKPTSRVYAEPDIEGASEGELMALLLTGKPLSEASAGDAYAVIAAMSGFGMGDGEGSFTSQIAQTLQLDELSINADDGLEHSSLWMGKYLTKRLFVRYVVGLFDQSSRIGMRYQVTDKLRLEAESGEAQSVDLIYKIER